MRDILPPAPLSRLIATALAVACALPAVAAPHPHAKPKTSKVKGPGSILVGNPEVVTRERLVNDRLTQERWLEDQLKKTESLVFGHQGLADMRSFLGLSARVGVETDSNLLGIYDAQSAATVADIRRQQEQAALQNRIKTLESMATIRDLEAELANGSATGTTAASTTDGDGSGGGGDSGGDGGGGDDDSGGDTPAAGEPPANPSSVSDAIALDFMDRLLTEKRDSLLPDPSSPTETKAVVTPIDEFRDRLAYREEVRNEIFENALDDRHDLSGNTAYRVNIDTTVLPKRKQDAWAVVEVEVREGPEPDWERRLNQWKIDLEREINALLLTRLQSAIPCYAPVGEDVSKPIEIGCLSEDFELDVSDHFQRLMRGNRTASCNLLFSTVEKPYFDALEVLGKRRRNATPRGAATWIEREDLAINLRAAIRAIMEACKVECSSELGALSYFLASYHQHVFAIEQGLQRFVTIKSSDCGEYPNLEITCPNIGEIRSRLADKARIYAFAATPKESVQRISEVAARRNAIELAALVSGRAGAGAAEAILESQRLLHGIGRQPLVVGYTLADNAPGPSEAATAGWIIGPKYKISDAVWTLPWHKGFRYEHVPIQNNLSFTMSVPEWWTSAQLTIRRHWRSTAGKVISHEDDIVHTIELPGKLSGITRALVQHRLPQVLRQGTWDVAVGKPAALLIRGGELWRSSRVTLGGQIANEIEVLPNMQGIVARFDEISEPASPSGKAKRENVPVRVWTSEGSQQAGTVTVHPGTPEKPKPLVVAVDPPRLVMGGDLVLEVTQGAIPEKREGLALQLLVWHDGAFGAPIHFAGNEIEHRPADQSIKATLTEAKLGAMGAKVPAESEIRAQLVINEKERGAPVTVNAANLVPYYTAEPKITFAVAVEGSARYLDGEVTLTTKKHMATAYPGFGKDSRVVFRAGDKTLRLGTTSWKQNTDGSFVLVGRLQLEALGDVKAGTGFEVIPELEDGGLASVGFDPAKLSLKKR